MLLNSCFVADVVVADDVVNVEADLIVVAGVAVVVFADCVVFIVVHSAMIQESYYLRL